MGMRQGIRTVVAAGVIGVLLGSAEAARAEGQAERGGKAITGELVRLETTPEVASDTARTVQRGELLWGLTVWTLPDPATIGLWVISLGAAAGRMRAWRRQRG